MNYRESLVIGLEGIRSHMLRSLLTMLGIIFGVGAVIAMLSIGEGAKREALEQIQLMGMHNIIVQDIPVTDAQSGVGRSSLSSGLFWADARAVQELNPLIEMTIPERELTLEVRYKTELVKTTVVGTTPEYGTVMNYTSRDGTFFNYQDVEESRRVCTLGSGIKRDLFYFRDPVGQKVKIGDQWYTVIGTMEDKVISNSGNKTSFVVRDMNKYVYVPLTSMLKRYPKQQFESEITRFTARVNDPNRIQEAANIARNTMLRRHNQIKDFEITIPEALLRQSQQTQRIFNIVMGAIAGISLLVGGIGIMNIMLATVLERTREIGIRRAVGATQRDILGQFLLEAVVLSFTGGLIGIILGFGMTKVIAVYAHWRTIVSVQSIFLAFWVSVAVGVIFGYYPARRAALKEPIEALRYE
ncbi:MAG: ABC transporter permease [Candidatus Latescibacter sp.]|nr:ABC transporter permease [Candidatus Latescibacter sp.]